MYFLKSALFKRQLQKQITGSAQLNFGPSHLKKMKINMPSIEKQNKIVEKLDKIQKIIDLRNKQLNMLKEVVKSQFVEMFENSKECKNGIRNSIKVDILKQWNPHTTKEYDLEQWRFTAFTKNGICLKMKNIIISSYQIYN